MFTQDWNLDVDVTETGIDTNIFEILYSTTVNSSEAAQWHKRHCQETTGDVDAKTLLLIVYWDKTSKDQRGKFMMHAVYVGLVQLDPDLRSKWVAKQLVGFLPIPKVNLWNVPGNVSENALDNMVRIFGRQLYQYSLRYMLEPIAYFQHNGLPFMLVDGETVVTLAPRVYCLSGDLPEGKYTSFCHTLPYIAIHCHT